MLLESNSCLFEVTLLRLVQMLLLNVVEAELNCIVTVGLNGLLLCDYARTCLNYRNRNNVSDFVEDLCHADLLSDNAFVHFVFPPVNYWLTDRLDRQHDLQSCRTVG